MKELGHDVVLMQELSAAELEKVREVTELRRYGAGEVILKQGAPVDAVYVLLEGAVRVTAVMQEGDELVGHDEEVLTRLKPGEVFGELSFITGAPPNLSVIAEEPSLVAAILQTRLRQLLDQDGPLCQKFLMAMMRLLVGRLRDTGRELVLTRYFGRGR